MFKVKNSRINITRLYINEHTLERFRNRKTKEIHFGLPKEIQIVLMPQRHKNNKNIVVNKLRAIIPLKNKLFIIGNIYEKDDALFFKALTVLNEKQLKAPGNFATGNYLKRGFLAPRPKIINEDKYFDSSYNDFLEKIEWEEMDTDYL